ncbi:MAG: hypothetical protein Athens071424_21 [Parcubacteria group bacterium Athens0714_24]|nr:MAG: hypothetical protein Athens071424_21 [Parcubacteria group bacterium Athens0714_24]
MNGNFENTKKPEETIPYDSPKELANFISRERLPIDYSLVINDNTKVIALGESHMDSTAKKEVKNSLTQFKQLKFTHLGLEFLGTDLQPVLDNYVRGKNKKDEEILLEHFKTYSERDGELYLEIVKEAISLGIKIVALDLPQKEKDYYEESNTIELQQKRNPFMAQRVENILSGNKEYRVITFSGNGHIQNIDEGTGSIVVNLRDKNISVVTINFSGRLIEKGYPYSYQGPSISECVQSAGLASEKFILPAQTKFPEINIPFDWIIYLSEK